MASLFAGEADFCPNCGRILPLPEFYDSIKCRTCSHQQKISRKNKTEYSCVMITEPSRDNRSHEKPSEGPYVLIIYRLNRVHYQHLICMQSDKTV